MEKVIYKELSYKIVGILYDVYNELGYGYQEKYYERAIVLLLRENNVSFKNQVSFILQFRGKMIGRYFLDFVIENKVVLEIKQGDRFSQKNINQIKGYLKVTGMKLAILAHFTSKGVKIFRAFNPDNL